MTVVDPISSATNFFIAIFNSLPAPIQYFTLTVALGLLVTSVVGLIFRG